MEKNLIKISGVYNNLIQGETFNIFCNIIIDLNKNLINIKNCEITQKIDDSNKINNSINFDEKNYYLFEEKFNKYYDNIIYNNLTLIYDLIYNKNNFEGYYNYDLKNLINFIFQFIYNELYYQGNASFEEIELTK